jgi:hypothetical protein
MLGIASDGRRNKSAKNNDRARPDRGGGMMQAALRDDRQIDTGEHRGGLAKVANLDLFDAGEAQFAIAELKYPQAAKAQAIGKRLILGDTPILVYGDAFLPRHIRLDQDAGAANGESLFRAVKIELARDRREPVIPDPAAIARPIVPAISFVIGNPLELAAIEPMRDVWIVPERLLAPRPPDQPAPVAERNPFAARGRAAGEPSRQNLVADAYCFLLSISSAALSTSSRVANGIAANVPNLRNLRSIAACSCGVGVCAGFNNSAHIMNASPYASDRRRGSCQHCARHKTRERLSPCHIASTSPF